MKRTGQVLPSRRMKMQNLKAAHEQRQPALRSKQGGKKDLLLRHPNFVAKSTDASFEISPLACEASALTTELTAPNRVSILPLKISFVNIDLLLRQILVTQRKYQKSIKSPALYIM